MKRIWCLTIILAFSPTLGGLTIGYNNRTLFACDTGSSECSDKMERSQAQAAEVKEEAIDPVCTMDVKKDPDKSIQHKGYTYYFCSKDCMDKFQKDTKKYACPCADMGKVGCNCYHCTGRGGGCDCLEKLKKEGKGHHQ